MLQLLLKGSNLASVSCLGLLGMVFTLTDSEITAKAFMKSYYISSDTIPTFRYEHGLTLSAISQRCCPIAVGLENHISKKRKANFLYRHVCSFLRVRCYFLSRPKLEPHLIVTSYKPRETLPALILGFTHVANSVQRKKSTSFIVTASFAFLEINGFQCGIQNLTDFFFQQQECFGLCSFSPLCKRGNLKSLP